MTYFESDVAGLENLDEDLYDFETRDQIEAARQYRVRRRLADR